MRVLKGLHTVQSKGKTYYYAWRGGPRITATPGSIEFIQAFATAHASRKTDSSGTISSIIKDYRASQDYQQLSSSSKIAYSRYLGIIDQKFGRMPLKAAEDPRARGDFKTWRDGMADKPRKADYAWTVLARILSFAKDRGLITRNVCEKGGKLYAVDRREVIWTDDDISIFLSKAPIELHWAMHLALWTGQRQSDLLRLTWADYQDGKLKVYQSKTGARVLIPVSNELADVLATIPRIAPTILTNHHKRPWRVDAFRTQWWKIARKAKITHLTFHDLRGTTVVRLALSGCSLPEICSITGHSLRDAISILDKHYLGGREALAVQAIAKLEGRNQEQKV